jgi:hypothetical protein
MKGGGIWTCSQQTATGPYPEPNQSTSLRPPGALSMFYNASKDAPFVGYEDLSALIMKRYIFLDVAPCSLVKFNRRFGGTSFINLVLFACLLHVGFLLHLLFDPKSKPTVSAV